MKTIKLGKKVRVSDPCYTDDVWCKQILKNVLPGEYIVKVTHLDDDNWGNRVSSLAVYHKKLKKLNKFYFDPYFRGDSLDWVELGEIGVDSGQAGIFSEETYRNDYYAEKNIADVQGKLDFLRISLDESGDVFYRKMCGMTVNSPNKYSTYERGVVSASGYGDGGYPLYVAYDENKNIIAIKIIYLFPEENEIESQLDDYNEN